MTSEADTIGIYIHVPFCLRKCPYCDFYSCVNRLHERDAYVQAVCRNIEYYSKEIDIPRNVDTIYFGGGTPSLLSAENISKIIECIYNSFNVEDPQKHKIEITMEVNPATVSYESLLGYRKAGVNRVSIGLQDLQNDALLTLGRLHTAEQGIDTVYESVRAGFENISCDIMIGTKGQTKKRMMQTLEELVQLPINHISAYMLKIEEGTPYAMQNMQNLVPDDDETAEFYLQMVSYLNENGFFQYEISNFAKKGFESRHNCRYWKLKPYLGIGPSAHSFIDKRFYVPSELDLFIAEEHQKILIEDEYPNLLTESIMLGLRLTEGIPLLWLSDLQKETTEYFAKSGLMKINEDRVCFTPNGFLVSNTILCEIL